MLRFKQVPGSGYVLAGVAIISGLYFPVSVLPDWLEWTSQVQPFTPTVDLMRNLVVGLPLGESALLELARIVGFTLALLPLSVWILARSIRAAGGAGPSPSSESAAPAVRRRS